MKTSLTSFIIAASLLTFVPLCHAADDILIADFEGPNYGAWKVEGTAFGTGPAHGTLPGQMNVTGYKGQGLVNSWGGNDDATGKLTSPPFVIARKFINFLIGGGMKPGLAGINLLADGKVIRTATGPNDRPGGSETLRWASWDVSDLGGKTATIEIVDQATGGWGHINVDNIEQSDTRKAAAPATREIQVTAPTLFLPVKNGAAKRIVSVRVGGKELRRFDIELADETPDWWAPLDVSMWHGQMVTLGVNSLGPDSHALAQIRQGTTLPASANLYHEALRGQFHFSPQRGWNNDPNGMVFSQGEYHLYFQHNPYGWDWGNMHWGHAVSPDLAHWTELPIGVYPNAPGNSVWSGSAVVDKNNTSGWKNGNNDLLVGAYTNTGHGENIIYSNDRGRTWNEYPANPVVQHEGRDPRLLWHAPSHQWVMAVYDEDMKQAKPEDQQGIAFYTSPDLKKWTFQSRISNYFECPDMFELPLDGDKNQMKWVLTAASSDYRVGSFDGKHFIPETPKLPGQRGKGFYAAQTFSNEPQGRRVQIGWFQTTTPGMSFNQSMSIPLELRLISTNDGPRLTWTPVQELTALRAKSHSLGPLTLHEGAANPLAAINSELLEVRAEFAPGDAGEIAFNVRGVPVVFDGRNDEIIVNGQHAPAPLRNATQQITIYADRTGLEVFTGYGRTFVPMPINLKPEDKALALTVKGGTAKFSQLDVHELKSAWMGR